MQELGRCQCRYSGSLDCSP